MNKNQIIAMAEKGLKVKDLGFRLNRHPGYLSNVLSGRYKSPETRKNICKILDKPEHYLWPEAQTDWINIITINTVNACIKTKNIF